MRRLKKGAPLRAAMQEAKLDISRLATRTRDVDPEGKGISKSMVGFIVGAGSSAREECSDRAAELVSEALGREVGDLFQPTLSLLPESTSTNESCIGGSGRPALPVQLMDQRALSHFLRKSMSWIDKQIQDSKERGETWPGLIYVGSSRRFDPHAVLEAMRQQRPAA